MEFRETHKVIRLGYHIVSHADELLLEKQPYTESNLSILLKLSHYLKTHGLNGKPGRSRRRDV